MPVSTAEPWHVWHDHPELAREVDYIAVHILPYWEGVPRADALDHVMMRYRDLRRAFPGKPILIAEVGWPSAGHRFGGAEPSRVDQAEFVRGFLNLAARERLDYFVMEVFDQGWKRGLEGEVGAHWPTTPSIEPRTMSSRSNPTMLSAVRLPGPIVSTDSSWV